jgi:hypothetical protein
MNAIIAKGRRRNGMRSMACVKARMPALDYVGIRTGIEWIWLQTWTRVIVGVDV